MSRKKWPACESLWNVTLGNLDERPGHRRDCAQVCVRFTLWAETAQHARERCTGLLLEVSPHGTTALADNAPPYIHDVQIITSTGFDATAVAPCEACSPELTEANR